MLWEVLEELGLLRRRFIEARLLPGGLPGGVASCKPGGGSAPNRRKTGQFKGGCINNITGERGGVKNKGGVLYSFRGKLDIREKENSKVIY